MQHSSLDASLQQAVLHDELHASLQAWLHDSVQPSLQASPHNAAHFSAQAWSHLSPLAVSQQGLHEPPASKLGGSDTIAVAVIAASRRTPIKHETFKNLCDIKVSFFQSKTKVLSCAVVRLVPRRAQS